MGEKVVLEEEVVAVPAAAPPVQSAVGVWKPGEIEYTLCDKLTVKSKPVVTQAKCTFEFEGNDSSSGAKVSASEKVELKASKTILKGGGKDLLVAGDSAAGSYGNQLTVKASGHLSTA